MFRSLRVSAPVCVIPRRDNTWCSRMESDDSKPDSSVVATSDQRTTADGAARFRAAPVLPSRCALGDEFYAELVSLDTALNGQRTVPCCVCTQ